MNIEEILINIPDKFQHKTTTSHKFKRELFEFFNKEEFKNKTCLEIVKYIGHEPKSNFTRPLFDYEGVICIEK